MTYLKFKFYLYTISLIFLCACTHQQKVALPYPEIQDGIALISGEISFLDGKSDSSAVELRLIVPAPVTGRFREQVVLLDRKGHFRFEIPIETDVTVGVIRSKLFNRTVVLDLRANKETRLEIEVDSTRLPVITHTNAVFTPEDMVSIGNVMGEVLEFRIFNKLQGKSCDEVAAIFLDNVNTRLQIARDDSILSDAAKELIIQDYQISYLGQTVLNYQEVMKYDYWYAFPDQKDNYIATPPEKSYYNILKKFDLNNPQYLYSFDYVEALQTLLTDETLNLPLIGETAIQDWLQCVKSVLVSYIGADEGVFYDLLIANAYTRQFLNNMQPLSVRQIENINHYFQKHPIEKMLLKKNQEIIEINNQNSRFPSKVCSMPDVSGEKIMESILANYKGKAVVIDFWATWCIPCLEGIEQSKQIKPLFKNDSIAFLYITPPSSPRKIWSEKIKGMHGDHYYLNQEQWEVILNQLGESGSIPLYLFIDSKGSILKKKRGMMSNDEMKNTIKQILP